MTEPTPDLADIFRARFIAARKMNGLKQEDVAARIGTVQQTVAKFELGKRGLSVAEMPAWAEAVGADWRVLLGVAEVAPLSSDVLRNRIAGLSESRAEIEDDLRDLEAQAKTLHEQLAEVDSKQVSEIRALTWHDAQIRYAEELLAERDE
jgi:transcriptional regulator with XRE-family HTH domain